MTRPNSRGWMLLLLMWPLIWAVSLVGCKRHETMIAEAEKEALRVRVVTDAETGCEYLAYNTRAITPRIGADGKTHMGCKEIAGGPTP